METLFYLFSINYIFMYAALISASSAVASQNVFKTVCRRTLTDNTVYMTFTTRICTLYNTKTLLLIKVQLLSIY